MKDKDTLTEQLLALDPSPKQAARMKHSVDNSVEAAESSLLAEWFDLLRVRPLANTAYAFAAASLLLLISPLGSLLFSLMRNTI